MNVRAVDKICITGRNGVGKSTLLRAVHDNLRCREDLKVFYMPQDPDDLLKLNQTPIDFLTVTGEKEENVAIMCAYMLMHFIASDADPLSFLDV
mgnify:CR=1 FL=1